MLESNFFIQKSKTEEEYVEMAKRHRLQMIESNISIHRRMTANDKSEKEQVHVFNLWI